MLTRRAVLATGAAAIAMPARAANQPITIVTPFGFIIDFLELMNGKSGGYYAAAGLDAQVLGAGGAAGSMQQLAAGRCDVIRGAPIDMMKAVAAQNLKLVSIATLFQASTFVVISARDKPIRTAEEFAGKRIGVVSIGGTTENFLDLMLSKVGVPKASVTREVVGNNPGAFALIQQGRIDGFIASSNVASALQRSSAPIEVWSTDNYAPMPSQIYIVTQDTIDHKPELVLAFARALKNSVLDILKGPIPPIIERASKDFEIPGIRDPAALANTIVEDIPLWLAPGQDNLLKNVPALWQSGTDAMALSGLAKIADPTALYTNRFIDEAMKG